MAGRRCTRCMRVLPLSEFDSVVSGSHCSICRNRTTSDDRTSHLRNLTYARRAAARAFDNKCSTCKVSLTVGHERANWRLAPRRKQGRLMVAELDALGLYSLSPEVLTTNFDALCSVHYYRHVVKEEACPNPPIPVAGLRRVRSERSPGGYRRSSSKATRTSGGKGTRTS